MDSTDFYDELQRKSRDLEVLIDTIQTVHQSSDLKQLYKTVLEVAEGLDFVHLMSVYLTDGEGGKGEAVLQVQGGSAEIRFKLPKRIPLPSPEQIAGGD